MTRASDARGSARLAKVIFLQGLLFLRLTARARNTRMIDRGVFGWTSARVRLE